MPEPSIRSWSDHNNDRFTDGICDVGNLSPNGEAMHGGEKSRRYLLGAKYRTASRATFMTAIVYSRATNRTGRTLDDRAVAQTS